MTTPTFRRPRLPLGTCVAFAILILMCGGFAATVLHAWSARPGSPAAITIVSVGHKHVGWLGLARDDEVQARVDGKLLTQRMKLPHGATAGGRFHGWTFAGKLYRSGMSLQPVMTVVGGFLGGVVGALLALLLYADGRVPQNYPIGSG